MSDKYAGKRNGKIEVIRSFKDGTKYIKAECKCDCGKSLVILACNLKNQKSCGCSKKVHRKTWVRNGQSKSRECQSWRAMLNRCLNPKNKYFFNYGERGITVCQRWVDSFDSFLEDMGSAPSLAHTLDRINNDLGYSPDNCRWATRMEQANNIRRNVMINYEGEIYTISNLARKLGVARNTIAYRIKIGKLAK